MPTIARKNKRACGSHYKEQKLERVKGIEPSLQRWQRRGLPLHHTRIKNLVPLEGLEPTHLSVFALEANASADSATVALVAEMGADPTQSSL